MLSLTRCKACSRSSLVARPCSPSFSCRTSEWVCASSRMTLSTVVLVLCVRSPACDTDSFMVASSLLT